MNTKYEKTNFDEMRNNIKKDNLTQGDRVFYSSIVRRQKMIIQDLCRLNKQSEIVENDILGGLYSLYCILEEKENALKWNATR